MGCRSESYGRKSTHIDHRGRPQCSYGAAPRAASDEEQKQPAAPARLPYGAVMATGAAAAMAGVCGLGDLQLALLSLALLEAVAVPVFAVFRRRPGPAGSRSTRVIIPWPEPNAGALTVPLGLAILTAELAERFGSQGMLQSVTGLGLALTWLATVLFAGRFLAPLFARQIHLHDVNGSWFLVPAAFLATAIATVDGLGPTRCWTHEWTQLAALASATVGSVGYWIVLIAASLRVMRHGHTGCSQAPWWISAGCAGLAVASLTRVRPIAVVSIVPGLRGSVDAAIVATTVAAWALLIPVVVGGSDFLLRRCKYAKNASWPPTFSMAVFAMGCLGAAVVLRSPFLAASGAAGAWATLAFWMISSAWNLWLAATDAVRSGKWLA